MNIKTPSKTLQCVILIVITAAVFLPSLSNGFLNWDDPVNVIENRMIRSLSVDNIKRIFTSYTLGSYHPIAVLTYAVNYKIHGLVPFGYHAFNLLFHGINVLLVYGLIYLLTKKDTVSFFVALLFSVHPLHVESVAWVTERRDLVYSGFYLAAMISYVFYLRRSFQVKYFLYLILFFILSLMSKSAAVTLPLTLFAVDYYLLRRIDKRMFLEKVPLFMLSVVFGVVAVVGVYHTGSAGGNMLYTLPEKIFLAGYTVFQYVLKMIFPYKLAVVYPWPPKEEGLLPSVLYLSLIPVLAAVFFIIRSMRRQRDYAFGALFFFFNVMLTLQLFIVGQNFLADRYTYISSIGIFFIFAILIDQWIQSKSKQVRRVLTAVLGVYIVGLMVISFNQCRVWKNSVSLWTNTIRQYPNLPRVYGQRAFAYEYKKDFDSALRDLDALLALKPDDADALNFRGVIYGKTGKDQLAIKEFGHVIKLNPNYAEAYNNRGFIYEKLKMLNKALADYSKAIELKPNFADALVNRGAVLWKMGESEKALDDFSRSAEIDPYNAKLYNNRGMIYLDTEMLDMALNDFNKAIELDPSLAVAYNNRGIIFAYKGDFDRALKEFNEALILDPYYENAFNNKLMAVEAQKR